MKCIRCGGVMVSVREDRRHADLPRVALRDIEVRRCAGCGDEEEVIPHIEHLHQVLANALVAKRARLSMDEIRFLRQSIGWTDTELAKHLGVPPNSVSRWERGQEVMDPVADRLLRMLSAAHIEGVSPPGETLATIADEVTPLDVRLRFGPDAWHLVDEPDPAKEWANAPLDARRAILEALAPERFSEKQRSAAEAAIAVLKSAARPQEAA